MQVVAQERFKGVLASVPTPVTVVSTLERGRPHGTTVSAFSSLSLEPPLVVVSLDRDSALLAALRRTRRFGVNVLQRDQRDHAMRFAEKGSDKFAGIDWHEDRGLPRLPGSAAWLACRVADLHPGGDHLLVTGLVEDAERVGHAPLVYRERSFATLIEAGAR